MPHYNIGFRVRRKADGLIQTIYDLDERARIILVNWVDDNHKMHREVHNIPVRACDPCPVELIDVPRNRNPRR